MKTGYELVDHIWLLLNSSASLKASITGSIFKHKRPDGSAKQDIVINSLTGNNEQLQKSVLNINFHCPNLHISVGGQPAVYVPDNVKLKNVSDMIISLVDDHWTQDFHSIVEKQQHFEESELKETFSNIRIIIYSINV